MSTKCHSKVCPRCSLPFMGKLTQTYCGRSCATKGNTNGAGPKHGLVLTSEYSAWRDMKARCQRVTHKNYAGYGGRGVKVCDRWQSFENFYADMGAKPGPDFSIDRIDNDGNYEPGNCRWATRLEQGRNRRNTYTLDDDRRLREAIARGMNFTEISAFVGKSRGSVTGRATRLGLHSGVPPIPKKIQGRGQTP